MLRAFSLAFAQLFDRAILGVLGICAVLSLIVFAALWWAVDWLLTDVLVDSGWLRTALDWLGVLASLVLAWLLFPLVASTFVGLFLDRVARIVERRHHPHLPPAPGLPWYQSLFASLRFLLLLVVANVLLLVLWFFPVAWPIAFVVVNGFLVGREYFDLVALRRLDVGAARALRRRHEGELLLTGAGLTLLMAVPFVNLIAPVFATAAMVHRFEQWRGGQGATGGG